MTSHFMIPPKMLIKIPFTLGSAAKILNASSTCFSLAPPPTSKKLAGSPPCSLITSIVDMASPAIHHAPDVAVEPDIIESDLLRLHFARVLHRGVLPREHLLVPVRSEVVEAELGVHAVHLRVVVLLGRLHERVDLHLHAVV